MEKAAAHGAAVEYGHWIGGRDLKGSSSRQFPSYNPTTGEIWGQFALGDKEDVAAAVDQAKAAFVQWRAMSPTRRGRLMMRWADAITANAEKIGRIETSQNGKLLNEMVLQAKVRRLDQTMHSPAPDQRAIGNPLVLQLNALKAAFEQ